MKRLLLVLAALGLAGACARALPTTGPDAGTDATNGGDASCPYNTTNDPQHCGTCTNACAPGEVCSSSVCKAQCDAPTTKCVASDGGATCADLTSDPLHCGSCSTACSLADAGALPPGTNNPDSGVVYDGGAGWSLGTPACDGGCGVACGGGMTACSDGVCYDTQNHHDHCGSCTNACQPAQWCNNGNCCAFGQEYCGSACIDVLGDSNNCGACGNVCGSGTPYCSGGACVKACVPSGTRQTFNTLASHTSAGCWEGNPCNTDAYSWSQTNGANFQAVGQNVVCSGATACVSHVGINTYSGSTSVCQGSWDVYCDSTKVGTIATTGKSCSGSAMTNGCSVTFNPMTCTTIQLALSAGSGVIGCCLSTGSPPDSMLTAVSAW